MKFWKNSKKFCFSFRTSESDKKQEVWWIKVKIKTHKSLFGFRKIANTEVAAEALLYAKAFYQNKGKAFKSSNETIFKLANNYASEEFWGAKSFGFDGEKLFGIERQLSGKLYLWPNYRKLSGFSRNRFRSEGSEEVD